MYIDESSLIDMERWPILVGSLNPETREKQKARAEANPDDITARAFIARGGDPEKILHIPLKVTGLVRGYTLTVWRVYQVGTDFIVHSKIRGQNEGRGYTVLQRTLKLPDYDGFDPTKRYRSVHFIQFDGTDFEYEPSGEPFLTLPVESEEEFSRHLRNIAQSADYIDTLKARVWKKEEPKVEPPSAPAPLGWRAWIRLPALPALPRIRIPYISSGAETGRVVE